MTLCPQWRGLHRLRGILRSSLSDLRRIALMIPIPNERTTSSSSQRGERGVDVEGKLTSFCVFFGPTPRTAQLCHGGYTLQAGGKNSPAPKYHHSTQGV